MSKIFDGLDYRSLEARILASTIAERDALRVWDIKMVTTGWPTLDEAYAGSTGIKRCEKRSLLQAPESIRERSAAMSFETLYCGTWPKLDEVLAECTGIKQGELWSPNKYLLRRTRTADAVRVRSEEKEKMETPKRRVNTGLELPSEPVPITGWIDPKDLRIGSIVEMYRHDGTEHGIGYVRSERTTVYNEQGFAVRCLDGTEDRFVYTTAYKFRSRRSVPLNIVSQAEDVFRLSDGEPDWAQVVLKKVLYFVAKGTDEEQLFVNIVKIPMDHCTVDQLKSATVHAVVYGFSRAVEELPPPSPSEKRIKRVREDVMEQPLEVGDKVVLAHDDFQIARVKSFTRSGGQAIVEDTGGTIYEVEFNDIAKVMPEVEADLFEHHGLRIWNRVALTERCFESEPPLGHLGDLVFVNDNNMALVWFDHVWSSELVPVLGSRSLDRSFRWVDPAQLTDVRKRVEETEPEEPVLATSHQDEYDTEKRDYILCGSHLYIHSNVAGGYVHAKSQIPMDQLCSDLSCAGRLTLDYDTQRGLHKLCEECGRVQTRRRK